METINTDLIALVLAGGSGTRFWPESTGRRPKQYLRLTGPKTLLEETLDRFEGLVPRDRRFIVTVKEQEHLARECAGTKITTDGMIFEPMARNTAPCILLSLAILRDKGAALEDVVAIVPADHVIQDQQGFREVLKEAFVLSATQKSIVTIGIPPYLPHTGYGYIEKGEELAEGAFRAVAFKEKPNFETAKSYLESKKYFWNAGMFVATVGTLLEEFQQHAPEIYRFYNDLKTNLADENKIREIYREMPKISVDYAIMEKSTRVSVIGARFDWNDLGSWDALETVLKPQDNNTVVEDKGHYFENAEGNIVFAPKQFVSLINVQDLIVIANHQSVVIIPKRDAQKIRNVVDYLQKQDLGKELL
jgi:mannose-1-phosphate guanylyltransferase